MSAARAVLVDDDQPAVGANVPGTRSRAAPTALRVGRLRACKPVTRTNDTSLRPAEDRTVVMLARRCSLAHACPSPQRPVLTAWCVTLDIIEQAQLDMSDEEKTSEGNLP